MPTGLSDKVGEDLRGASPVESGAREVRRGAVWTRRPSVLTTVCVSRLSRRGGVALGVGLASRLGGSRRDQPRARDYNDNIYFCPQRLPVQSRAAHRRARRAALLLSPQHTSHLICGNKACRNRHEPRGHAPPPWLVCPALEKVATSLLGVRRLPFCSSNKTPSPLL